MNIPSAGGGRRERPRPRHSPGRRALYAATVLAPLGAVAVFVLAHGGGDRLSPMLPVQPAVAQQALPADDGAQPFALAAAPPGTEAIPGGALGVLLEQASYWRVRQRYDQALTSLTRALKLAPDNADALALMAQVQSEKGDQKAAAAALERLKKVAPTDPRIDKIEQTIKVGPITPEQLSDARRLAQSGKQAEAVDRYNRLFKGNPPPDALAVEYYQTLAGAEGGYDQAKEGLAKLVRNNPQDLRAQLGYAQVLTYRDAGRIEGIQRLAALAQNPAVAEQATQAWRQALGWLPDTKESIEPIQSYLATHPTDADMATKLSQAKNPLLGATPGARSRLAGFDALNTGKLADAEKLFQAAVDADASDADAAGGLGLVKLRQKNFADAKTLLARAIALDPEHKGRWQSALTAASNPGGGPNPAVAMITRGDFPAAERELSHQIAQGGDVVGLQGMLADAQARQGRLDEAEATYRAALGRAPNNAQILVGLAGVLSRQGRGQEASELLDRAQAAGGNSRLVGQARALQLREQASAITDPATQVGLYRAAVAADPDSPWLRLDLARALFKLGQVGEARDVMAQVIGTSPTTDALKAGIIFANETSDPDAAATLIARLPPGMRTPDMRTLQVQSELQREIGMALLLSRPVARQKLLAMAAQPDPDGVRGAAVARALGEIGDKFAAREAVVAAQASSPSQPAAAKLRYAGALMDADDPQGAQDMLAQIGGARGLSAGDRQQLVQLQAGLAVRTSDKLNEQGRQADAYDHLAPLLAQAPENPDLNLALARLYQGARNPREALQISQTLLRRDPNNIEARKGAVEAALQLGDHRLAESLVQEGEQRAPNDPKTWMMAADVDKARGSNSRALRDLERARELRLQQLGYPDADTGADSAPMSGVSLVPGAVPNYQPVAPRPVYRPALPSADGGADQPADSGADRPPDLSVPPLLQERAAPPATTPGPGAAVAEPTPPFQPQPTTAEGSEPSYQPPPLAPPPARRLLDTSGAETPPPSAFQPPPFRPQPYQPQSGQPPSYRPPDYQVAQVPGALPVAQPQTAPGYPPQSPQQYPQQYRQQYPAQYPPQSAQPYPPFQPGQLAPPPATGGLNPGNPFASGPIPPRPLPTAAEPSQGYYANPFRQGSGDALSDSEAVTGKPVPDPVTEEIDRNIIALRDSVAPTVQAGFGVQNRSGQSGLDLLNDLTLPLEATFAPGGFGRLRLVVTPTILTSGQLGGGVTSQQLFGTNALALKSTLGVPFLTGNFQPDQHANGLGLDVGYSIGSLKADVGSTPFGFERENTVGGIEWAPQITDRVRLRLLGERRAVTDSILSYAGTDDPRTGERWGGVVQDHARATLEFSAGRADFYLLGGAATFNGDHVQHNTEFEAGAGGSYPVYRTTSQEVRVGLDLVYFGYQHNQDFFTLGQGGYFSPQSFIEAIVPVNYKEQVDEDLSYEIGGSAGYATFRESPQPYYPLDSDLQAQLVTQQTGANAVAGVLSEYAGRSVSGFAATARASVDYRVSPSLHLGGKLDFAHSPAYDETVGIVYAKYLFNGADK